MKLYPDEIAWLAFYLGLIIGWFAIIAWLLIRTSYVCQ